MTEKNCGPQTGVTKGAASVSESLGPLSPLEVFLGAEVCLGGLLGEGPPRLNVPFLAYGSPSLLSDSP